MRLTQSLLGQEEGDTAMPASAATQIQSSWQELAKGRTHNPCPPTPL